MKLSLIKPKHYYHEFLKFARYILNPVHLESNKSAILQNIKGTWSVFVIKTILTIVVGVLVTLLIDPVNQTKVRWNELYSTGGIFLLSIIILPLLEEIAFRLSLKFRPIYLALTLGILTYYGITKIAYRTNLSNVDNHFNIGLSIGIIVVLISYFVISQSKIKNLLDNFWEVNFKWIFYVLCFAFAWMHILNYTLNRKHLLLLPLITLPKLIAAFSYGYIRMHYGFLYSLGLHMFWNSIGFIMSLFPTIDTDLIL